MNRWTEQYDRKNRPSRNELSNYLSADVMELFLEFSNYLAIKYGLNCAPAVYNETLGWFYKFGRNNMYLINVLSIRDDYFYVEGICVDSKNALKVAIEHADKLYADGFQEKYIAYSEQKSAAQVERTKKRLEREKKELEALAAKITKEKFNKYRWSSKLSRQKLRRLYESDDMGIHDEELVDDIGYTLYTRCLQGRDERALIEIGQMKCHGCGELLPYKKELIECDCGCQYMFRDYMRSFRTNNMPSGSATHIFNEFIEKWPQVVNYSDKMKIIDELVHEFHINLVTGVKGRFVGINLIEGNKKQIGDLILSLAYSENTMNSKYYFERNLYKI